MSEGRYANAYRPYSLGKNMTLKKILCVPGLVFLLTVSLANAASANVTASSKPDIQAEIQTVLTNIARELFIPGVLTLIHTPQANMLVIYGTNELGKNNDPRVNTQFRIGSNTKSMISAVIVQLAQEGKLKLDDPVSKYIPDVPNGDKISLDLLMKNRSGLYNYLESPKLAKEFDANPSKIWTPQELLNLSFEQPLQFQPDERFDYCNTNFIVLGLIAEKLDKTPLEIIFKKRLFEPLGMKHTYLPGAFDTVMKKPYSHGYAFGKSAHVFTHEPYSAEMISKIKNGKVKPVDYTVQSPSWAWAAGGVVSTAEDVAIWIESLAQGKLFNQEYYQKWLKSPVPSDAGNPNIKYGYGFLTIANDAGLFFFHSGELPGFNSYMIHSLEKKQTIVIWSSLTISVDLEPTAGLLKTPIFNVLNKS